MGDQRYFETFSTVRCKMDSYNNDGYIHAGVPKRIYHDAKTGKIGCKVYEGKFSQCDTCKRKVGLFDKYA
jgi:hypothetical protein